MVAYMLDDPRFETTDVMDDPDDAPVAVTGLFPLEPVYLPRIVGSRVCPVVEKPAFSYVVKSTLRASVFEPPFGICRDKLVKVACE